MTMIMKNMSIIITIMMKNADADMTTLMKNMNIIITTMMKNADADMTTLMKNMSIIITTMIMNADVDTTIMTITIIMQMKYLQVGVVRQLRNIQKKILRRCWKLFLHLMNMESFSVQKECFRQKMEHGFILIWFPEETEIREGAPEYTGRLCVIGSKLNEDKLAEHFWPVIIEENTDNG